MDEDKIILCMMFGAFLTLFGIAMRWLGEGCPGATDDYLLDH